MVGILGHKGREARVDSTLVLVPAAVLVLAARGPEISPFEITGIGRDRRQQRAVDEGQSPARYRPVVAVVVVMETHRHPLYLASGS